MVKHTAMKLAELKGLPFLEVALATSRNSAKLFQLEELLPPA
jgi:Tat protein secretion system quality control protein TatD with DNase activity